MLCCSRKGDGQCWTCTRAIATLLQDHEQLNFTTVGLPQSMVNTNQGLGLPPLDLCTTSGECLSGGVHMGQWDHIPFQCSVPAIVSLLQELIDGGKLFTFHN